MFVTEQPSKETFIVFAQFISTAPAVELELLPSIEQPLNVTVPEPV